MKIGIGTVQFGLSYGVSNTQGQTSISEVKKILQCAKQHNISILDTAATYGASEAVLGKTVNDEDYLSDGDYFKIVTKTPKANLDITFDKNAEIFESTFFNSLQKLQRDSVYGLLVHNADDLLSNQGDKLFQVMQDLQGQGLVKKIGISVYKQEQIEKIIERFAIDLIQLPINVFDQRLLQTGCLHKLKQKNIEVHARSVFLQGLLLMQPQYLADYFMPFKQHIADYINCLQAANLSLLEGALGFVMGINAIDCIVCGINNCAQLEAIISAAQPIPNDFFAKFAITNETLINPAVWKL
jgi:aryl-alcohol dehydrogenase-like predicted oxidoreductase